MTMFQAAFPESRGVHYDDLDHFSNRQLYITLSVRPRYCPWFTSDGAEKTGFQSPVFRRI